MLNVSSLDFHPDFEASTPDESILQANNELCFRFPLPVLSQISSFFEDLEFVSKQMPIQNETKVDDVIPLSAATWEALEFVLIMALAMTSDSEEDTTKVEGYCFNNAMDIRLESLINMFDIYDLWKVANAMLEMNVKLGIAPFDMFIIASVMEQHAIAQQSLLATPLLQIDLSLGSVYCDLIQSKLPKQQFFLERLWSQWSSALGNFRKLLLGDIATQSYQDSQAIRQILKLDALCIIGNCSNVSALKGQVSQLRLRHYVEGFLTDLLNQNSITMALPIVMRSAKPLGGPCERCAGRLSAAMSIWWAESISLADDSLQWLRFKYQ